MKTREEYLVDYENKLIVQFTEIFKNQGKNLFIIYVISGFHLLFVGGYIEKINLFGNSIDLDTNQLRLFIPYVLISLYLFVNYQTIRIAKTIHRIRNNSNEILAINENARPITTNDIFYFSSGLSGLVLAFAKWQFTILVSQKIYSHYKKIQTEKAILKKLSYSFLLLFNISVWFILSYLSLSIVLMLYVFPLIIVSIELDIPVEVVDWQLWIKNLGLILFFVSLIATMASVIILLSSMLYELIQNLQQEVETSMIELRQTFVSRLLIKVIERISDITIRF